MFHHFQKLSCHYFGHFHDFHNFPSRSIISLYFIILACRYTFCIFHVLIIFHHVLSISHNVFSSRHYCPSISLLLLVSHEICNSFHDSHHASSFINIFHDYLFMLLLRCHDFSNFRNVFFFFFFMIYLSSCFISSHLLHGFDGPYFSIFQHFPS